MQVDDTREYTGPITVDRQFILAVDRVFDTAARMSRGLVANRYNLTDVELSHLEAGEIPAGRDKYELIDAKSDLRFATTRSYNVKFESGTTVATGGVDELLRVLDGEPSAPRSFEATMGMYRLLHVKLSIGSWTSKAVSIAVQGESDHRIPIREAMEKAVINAESDGAFLYSKWPGRILIVVIAVYWSFVYLSAMSNLSGPHYRALVQAMAAAALPSLIPVMLVGGMAAESLRTMFPQIEYDFGVRTRRRRAKRQLVSWLSASVFVPIALLILSLVLS